MHHTDDNEDDKAAARQRRRGILTTRDRELISLVAIARYLSTAQVNRLVWGAWDEGAARKREPQITDAGGSDLLKAVTGERMAGAANDPASESS